MKHLPLLCSLLALTLAGCSEPAAEPAVRPVRAIKVGDVEAIQGRWYPGRAEAAGIVELSFRVSGPLVALPVRVGEALKTGDLIAAIDPSDFQTAVDLAKGNLERARSQLLAMERGARPEEIEQLRAALAEARAIALAAQAEFDRNSELLPSRAISRSQFDLSLAQRDRSAAQVKIAEANLEIGRVGAREEDLLAKRAEIQALQATVTDADNRLKYTRLLAPFDGNIAARFVENFQTIQAKQPVVRLIDSTRIEVTVQLPESVIALVPLVQDVTCQFDALPGQEFTGRITEVGTEASQSTRTFPVTVQVDQPEDAKIRPGMAGRVRGNPRESDADRPIAIVVPVSAVFAFGAEKQSHVWVVDEFSQTVTRRPVTTAELTSGGIRVTEGLQVGEWVVTAGVETLEEGRKVRRMPEGGA